MIYESPELLTSYAVTDLYEGASGFASVNPCDPFNNNGDLGNSCL